MKAAVEGWTEGKEGWRKDRCAAGFPLLQFEG